MFISKIIDYQDLSDEQLKRRLGVYKQMTEIRVHAEKDCRKILRPESNFSPTIQMWYDNASFAIHPNMRSHTGGGLTMGRGFPIVISTKQKLNTKSSTESEIVGVDDMMPIVVWSRYFLMAQGYGVTQNLLLQDNQSSILLERNGKASSGKRTRHINIRYFFITDRVNMKEIEIEWCPTKEMVADFMTKPLQGSHFRRLCDLITFGIH